MKRIIWILNLLVARRRIHSIFSTGTVLLFPAKRDPQTFLTSCNSRFSKEVSYSCLGLYWAVPHTSLTWQFNLLLETWTKYFSYDLILPPDTGSMTICYQSPWYNYTLLFYFLLFRRNECHRNKINKQKNKNYTI